MGKFDKLFESCTGFNDEPKEGVDYYTENGYRILTADYLARRGWCCANGCRHCPYWPKAQKGNTILNEKIKKKLN